MKSEQQPRGALTRRAFIHKAGAAGAAIVSGGIASSLHAAGANEKIVVGVMGASRTTLGGNGRGSELAVAMASLPGVEIAYVCDVDQRHLGRAIDVVAAAQEKAPRGVSDFRRILDDKHVDAMIIAAPDHWHAPATILGCSAGKHIYVEKPCSHNPQEGEWMVAAARKHQRHVQLGTQRRSWPGIVEGIERLHSGEIGRLISAKTYYFADRPTIGHGKSVPVPQWLDFDMWQGPAPQRPYRDNLAPYNWHWFWHWGTAELGNNGVHTLDIARWGLGVDYPQRVTANGGKYRYDDDQETPDTSDVSWHFGDKLLSWEQRSWAPQTRHDPDVEIAFYGEKGMLAIRGLGYSIYDLKGNEISKGAGPGGEKVHLKNFLDAIRGQAKLHAEIEEGYKSTLLCHLGNIAYRTGHAIHMDPVTHRIAGDNAAMALWSREYRKGWEPKV